jgi:diguanylate cyclase (GGDEF)-like protein
MSLDESTLTVAGGLVTLSSGVFTLVFWWQDRTAWPAFWWGSASSGSGCCILLLAFHAVLPFVVTDVILPLIFNLCAVLVFVAARIFNRGSTNRYPIAVGLAVWLTLQMVTGACTQVKFAIALSMGVSAGLDAAAAFEFWLGRSEVLRGRTPLIVILCVHAVALALTALQVASTTSYEAVPAVNWLGVIHFVGLVYALGVTLFLTTMLKERSAGAYKAAALVDPLTGLPNRRAFMDQAKRVFDRSTHDATPIALLAFDLDRFKRVNDTFGHATGDTVLQTFASVLSATLRATNIIGRLGGEEFVAIIPGASDQAAVAIANRIRDCFQREGEFVNGQRIGATVSVGVTTTAGQPCLLADILANADAALYRAKEAGRNRVVLAPSASCGDPINVVRIA